MSKFIVGCCLMFSLPAAAQTTRSVVYRSPQAERSGEYADANSYQKDLLLFFDLLKSTHSAFAPESAAPFDIDQVCAQGYKWADRCSSVDELWRYLQRVVSTLNDGHTTLFPDYLHSRIYPFMFRKVGGNF